MAEVNSNMAVSDIKKYEPQNDSFSKSNTLISSKYKASLFEQKILNIVLAKLQHDSYNHAFDDEESLICEIKANELKHILHTNGGSFYTQLKPVAASMTSKTIGFINDETKTFKYVSLISYAEYDNGIFRVKFNDELKQYLSPTTQFTVLELKTILQYSSIYPLRLHELLLSRCYKKKKSGVGVYTQTDYDGKHFVIDMDLSELKLCLGVVNAESYIVQKALAGSKSPDYDMAVEKASEKSFSTWYEFRRKVIDVSVREINKMDNGIHVEYEPMRAGKGGKVYAVKFFVELGNNKEEEKEKEIKTDELSEEQQFEVQFQVKSLIQESLTFKDIKAICDAANYDYNKIYKAYEVACASSNISNLVGFMINAIKEDYSKPVQKKKENKFNNFNQREYDFDKMEKDLLNL